MSKPIYTINNRHTETMEFIGDKVYNCIVGMYTYEHYDDASYTPNDLTALVCAYCSREVQAVIHDRLNVSDVVALPKCGPKSASNCLEIYIAHLMYDLQTPFGDIRKILYRALDEIDINDYASDSSKDLNVFLGTTYKCNPKYDFNLVNRQLTIYCNGKPVFVGSKGQSTVRTAKIEAATRLLKKK
jgi:dsRNA-specific ribonuclease